MEELLKVEGLRKYFPVAKGLLFMRVVGWIKAVDGISFAIKEGQTFGLVGESGCGKTTTARLILLLERPTAGAILFQGKDVTKAGAKDVKRYRTCVQAVFQDPYSSLNPRMRIGSIIAEPLIVNNSLPRKELNERVGWLLEQVGLPPAARDLYPHEFSGGQRQRIALARALALNPKLIILDEPVSALDVSIRAQIMNLFKDLQQQLNLAFLLIAHNLATIRYMSHRVGVMYLGKLVEQADGEELFCHPLHPYTRALLSAALPSHPDTAKEEIILSGEVPSPLNPPPGCRFHPRCFAPKGKICALEEPELKEVSPDHWVACHHY